MHAPILGDDSFDALVSFFSFALIFGIGRSVSYLPCDAFRNAFKRRTEIQYEAR